MATNFSVGHGMRRRMGIPSNSLESAGKSMARTTPTTEEHLAATGANSARIPMGMDAYVSTPMPALQGTLMPKHNVQAGDPTGMGTKQNRQNMLYSERLGASYIVKASMGATLDPAAGATMANARIVPSVQGRQNPNFASGIQGASL
jgi:hypothetical protein